LASQQRTQLAASVQPVMLDTVSALSKRVLDAHCCAAWMVYVAGVAHSSFYTDRQDTPNGQQSKALRRARHIHTRMVYVAGVAHSTVGPLSARLTALGATMWDMSL
jgi:hypothetical protein